MHTDIEMDSRAFLSAWSNYSWCLNACAHCKRQVLAREHARLTDNDQACDETETHLRGDKPVPVDVAREQRIEQAEHRVNQTRPQHRRDQSSEHDGATSEHGKHRAIEQT